MKRASISSIKVHLNHLKMTTENKLDITRFIFPLHIHPFPDRLLIFRSLSTVISPKADFKSFNTIVSKIQGAPIPREPILINSLFGKLQHPLKDYLLSIVIFCIKPSKRLSPGLASEANQNGAYPGLLLIERLCP